MRAVLSHSIAAPRSLTLLLLLAALLAMSIFVALARSGVSPTAADESRPPAIVSVATPTIGGSTDSSPQFGLQP